MPVFLPDETLKRLFADLSGAFMAAATSATSDLNDKLGEALAIAGVLPESSRGDYEGEV